MTETWIQWGLHPASQAAGRAARLESAGWDGVMVFDSQSLLCDPYVALSAAASSTTQLGLGIGVSNSITRHPAVTASSIASLHELSGGRAVLGLGRGNSSLAYLGAGPATLTEFESQVRQIRQYLSGEGVDVADTRAAIEDTTDYQSIRTGVRPEKSRLEWLDPSMAPAVLEVAATGPRVMAIGATYGDRVSVSVGADPNKLTWAAETIRSQTPKSRQAPALTAYVSLAVHKNESRACELAAPEIAMHAHIMAFVRNQHCPLLPGEEDVFSRVAEVYDMTRHGNYGPQTDALTETFIQNNAVVGNADTCVTRLRRITDLGFDRIVVMMPLRAGGELPELFNHVERDVLPQVRR